MVLPSIFFLNCGFNGMCKKSSTLAEHPLGQTVVALSNNLCHLEQYLPDTDLISSNNFLKFLLIGEVIQLILKLNPNVQTQAE